MTFSNQMTKIDLEKFIAEERKLAAAEELAKQFGELLGSIILLFAFPTIIWLVLTFIFALNIAWVKVFGAYFLFNLFKNIIVNSLKK
jgi:hypothetical protein